MTADAMRLGDKHVTPTLDVTQGSDRTLAQPITDYVDAPLALSLGFSTFSAWHLPEFGC